MENVAIVEEMTWLRLGFIALRRGRAMSCCMM
jgi:hypothetical protein